MTTLVGTQTSFIDAVYALIELDYDAIEAYEAAINRLENAEYRLQMQQFKADHERHVVELSEALAQIGQKPPTGPDAKQYLTQGKVVLAKIMGDKAILTAMRSNEIDTNTAYERVSMHEHITAEFTAIVQRGFADEKRHKAWLEEKIAL